MTAKEWLELIQQAEDYNPNMTNLIKEYGRILLSEKDKETDKVVAALQAVSRERDNLFLTNEEKDKKIERLNGLVEKLWQSENNIENSRPHKYDEIEKQWQEFKTHNNV